MTKEESPHSGVLFLTRATKMNTTIHPSFSCQGKILVPSSFEQVHLKDIAWCESYQTRKNLGPHESIQGCICLMNSGEFKIYLQSAGFVRVRACAIIGRWAKQGLPIPNIPWATE